MKWRGGALLSLGILFLLATGAPGGLRGGPKETTYENRPMSYWLKALADKNPRTAGDARDALQAIGGPAVPGLIQIAEDKRAESRARGLAVSALAYIWPEAKVAIPLLIELARGPDPNLRVDAAFALSRLDPSSKELTVSVLADSLGGEKHLARSAAHALGTLGPQASAAVPALVKALKHDDLDVRLLAAFSLGRIGPEARGAIPALAEVAEDEQEDKALRDNALTSLRAIRGEITLQPH